MATEGMNPRPSNVADGAGNPPREFLELLADWIALYEGNYPKEPTEATIAAYKLGLFGLRPNLLHRAFARCLRECAFWPTVAEVRKAYMVEAQSVSLDESHALPEANPEWTPEQRKTWQQEMSKVAKKIGAPHMTEKQFDERKELLRRQAAELQAPPEERRAGKGAGK